MVVGHELDKIFKRLNTEGFVQLQIGDSTVQIKSTGQDHKFELSTEVYYGGNYIPGSVRSAVQNGHRKDKFGLPTQLRLDEAHFRIFLIYQDITDKIDGQQLAHILEEFALQANVWRLDLDDHDRNDLVYINAK